MQQGGTLKKRKKRNIAKVKGLSSILYSEENDDVDGTGLFSPLKDSDNQEYIYYSGQDTRINISAFQRQHGNSAASSVSSTRVTRNPYFHTNHPETEEIDWESRASTAETNTLSKTDRPNLLDKTTMNRLRQVLILGASSGAFPWKWDKNKRRIEKWSPGLEKAWNIQWFFVTIQILFITVFQFYSFINRVSNSEHETYRGVFMTSFSVYWYVCAVYFNVNMFIYKDQIRQYVNTLLDFNERYVEKYVVDLEDCQLDGKVFISYSIPSNCSQVFASVALFLVMPYQPWYLFSYIYPKPWYWLIPGAMQEFIMAGQVITSYMLISWIIVAHSNSVQFWLRETHKDADSDYTMDSIRHPQTAVETYRALQVLCTCFNDCMSPLAIPFVKLHTITGLIPCGYVLIRSMNHIFVEEFPGILTYPIGVFDTTTAGFTFLYISATMHELAYGFVDSWSRTKNKDFRRILMSCPALKVKVRNFYFVTVTTTITFFQAAFDLITDCIITFP